MARYEGGGLTHAAGGERHPFLCVGARYRAGAGGHQETFGVVLASASASAQAVPAGVAEAPALDPAHQALGDHLVEPLAVLLGNEDPGEHVGHKLRFTGEVLYRRPVGGFQCKADLDS